jgi:hypothetical protein
MQAPNDVLNSPAVVVLCGLTDAGLDLAVVDGRLRVWPVNQLTSSHVLTIQQHRDALVTLVRICDAGVQDRVAMFKALVATKPADVMLPALIFRPGTPYAKGICFSCGDALPETRWGRCWRCSLAWRMAAGVPIPAEHAAVYDGARVVA